jgi:hypothetical protein
VGAYETVAEKIKRIEGLGVRQIIFKLSPAARELEHIEKLLTYLR